MSPVTPTCSRRPLAPGTGFSRPSPRRIHSPRAQMESRGALGGRKLTHAPRQQIKCAPAGQTWGLVLSCPPKPRCLVSSHKHSLRGSARQLGSHGGGHLARGVQNAMARSSHGLSGLTAWPVMSTPGPHPQEAWARGLTQGANEQLACPRGVAGGGGVQRALHRARGLTGSGGDRRA